MTERIKRLLTRRGTEADWIAAATIPAIGEPCMSTDTMQFAIGDGVNPFALLPKLAPSFSDRSQAKAWNAVNSMPVIMVDGLPYRYAPDGSGSALVTDSGRTYHPAHGMAFGKHYGMDHTGATSSQAALQAFVDGPCTELWVDEGVYDIGTIDLSGVTGKTIRGTPGKTVFVQKNAQMFIGGDLEGFTISGIDFKYQRPGGAKTDCVFDIGAHTWCRFTHLRFYVYADAQIMNRKIGIDDAGFITHNVYAHWFIAACNNIDTIAGLEGVDANGTPMESEHLGDGTRRLFRANVVFGGVLRDILWSEISVGAVVVQRRKINGVWAEVNPLDYSVAFDGSTPVVDMNIAPVEGEVLRIYPSMPVSAQHHPTANNLWMDIRASAINSRGYQCVRYVDSEFYLNCRLKANGDNVWLWSFNPYIERNGQGGDHMVFFGCWLTFNTGADINKGTLRGIVCGPGSQSIIGQVSADFGWVDQVNTNRLFQVRDNKRATLTGTYHFTAGSNIVTTTGARLSELTRIGAVKDRIRAPNGGGYYGIAAIDFGNNTITLGGNSTETVSGVATRINQQNSASCGVLLGRIGEDDSDTLNGQLGHIEIGSCTRASGVATIPAGQTWVQIEHGLCKAPDVLVVSPDDSPGSHWFTGARTATTFRINLATAPASDVDFNWFAEVKRFE